MPVNPPSRDGAHRHGRPVCQRPSCEIPGGRTVYLWPNGTGQNTFLDHAAPGTAPGRAADSAYHLLTERGSVWTD